MRQVPIAGQSVLHYINQ